MNDVTGNMQARTQATIDTANLGKSPPSKHRFTFLNVMSFTTFTLGIILILYFFYLLFWPFNPLTIKSTSIVTPNVKQGGTLIYKISSCKRTQDTPTVNKKIVSAMSSQSLPTVNGVVSPGCSTTQVPVHIIEGTPPGKYTLETEVVYHINGVRDIHVFWTAGPFNVTN